MLSLPDIEALHAKHNKPGFGTTTPEELAFIQTTIHAHKPKRFIEVGTASGLTTGFIALFMEEIGGGTVTSIDSARRFFGDPSKPVGYLAPYIYGGEAVDIQICANTTVLDADTLGGPWDMAFVDADHSHPWPTLDTLVLAPHLTGPRLVLHHDLQLFRRHVLFRGVGPRALFNEVPEEYRHADPANGWNMFYMDLNMPQDTLTEVVANALCMPWTDRPPIPRHTLDRFRAVIRTHYGADLAQVLDEAAHVNRWSLPKRAVFALRHKVSRIRKALSRTN